MAPRGRPAGGRGSDGGEIGWAPSRPRRPPQGDGRYRREDARHGGTDDTEECLPQGLGATGGYPAVASSAAGGGAPSTHIR